MRRIVTGETAFKWGAIRPLPGVYDFAEADRLMAFAERHAMMVRGHTLLWHAANPDWLKDSLNAGNAERLLLAHIRTVGAHCRNRVVHWDVVNEVIDRKDGKPLALRDSIWTRALGPDCIDIAFRACAETDPAALRFINEYGIDYDWDDDEHKRQDLLALLVRLKARGVPVQGLGIQAHLDASVGALNQAKLAQFCNDVASLGLKIVITELDVRDNKLPADTAVRDAAVASHTRAYLDAVLSCPAVLGVLSWGLSDRRTWLNDELPRDDKLPQRALPLDAEFAAQADVAGHGGRIRHSPRRAHDRDGAQPLAPPPAACASLPRNANHPPPPPRDSKADAAARRGCARCGSFRRPATERWRRSGLPCAPPRRTTRSNCTAWSMIGAWCAC